MFGRRFKILDIAGIPICVDASWFLIVALITWSLASAFFPFRYRELSEAAYWLMGGTAALGVFVSILLHELSHAAVALRFGIAIEGITLFIFGGVAEMKTEPPNAKAEFWVAIAGPIASALIAGVCFLLAALGSLAGVTIMVVGVVSYLSLINTVLVVFNMIPAFPLDGGRVLRAVLWHRRGNLKSATKTTSDIGAAFGTGLIVLGVISIMSGNFVGGMWQFLIGMFLRGAAQMSYRQLLLRRALEGEPVERFMREDVITVARETSVASFVEDYVYRFHHKMFPVMDGEQLVGVVTTRQLRDLPKSQWGDTTVAQLCQELTDQNSVTSGTDSMVVLEMMHRHGAGRLVVVDGRRHLCGIVALKDLLRFISLKIELEGEGDARESKHWEVAQT